MKESAIKPDFETFSRRAGEGNMIPVYTELVADYETPVSAYRKICDGSCSFLFESAEKSDEIGRYSFLGVDPRMVFSGRGPEVTIREAGKETRTYEAERDPFHELETLMGDFRPVPDPALPVFYGGAVGYLAYDAVRYFEPTVPEPPQDELGLPEMVFLVSDTLIIFDHRYRKMQVVANVCTDDFEDLEQAYASARGKIENLVTRLERPLSFQPLVIAEGSGPVPGAPTSNTTKEQYQEMVRAAKEYIYAGDVFQVVPSQRFSVPYSGEPIDFYRALRHINPSPYMFCLQFDGDFSLVGSSPEVHVRAIDGKIEIRPIAGTRPRGADAAADAEMAQELLGDPKELAEHVMLVDLARNDVGRIAEFESVKVTEFKVVEKYSHVMHIVSNVVGRLRGDCSAYDVMRATFPAGTVSGSPKVRAMQIINELEKSKRCAYAGAVGYFGFDGNHDSCIALRTAVIKEGSVHIQAGAGVVADSDPEKEYEETVNKAMGLIRAVERAKQLGSG
ncbi:MAG: anthranilate synthase component I [Verrucomicrobiales bacterium]